jgi:uncharacterized phage protein (predicted DNA packaging)
MIIDLQETKSWLRIDGSEEDSTIEMLIGAAEAYLKNATGRDFDSNNDQAKLFCLVLVADWFENRDLVGTKPSDKVRFSMQSILAQLQYTPTEEPEGGDTSG